MQIDTSKWSGEGTFTQVLIDRLQQIDRVALIRVEDAPASRSEADYNFISNEIFVGFRVDVSTQRFRRFGILPATRDVERKTMSVGELELALAAEPDVGEPDYVDDGMMQYLRTERIIPPYQTRGYKLVELVRIYDMARDASAK
ncbi:MAG TPA: hypothetical protein VHU82_12600 [Vicinamibacterales bacterium]|jgi:hypothetical protein|nr:hypothetical protein [Vicinamibacterales bacterium]